MPAGAASGKPALRNLDLANLATALAGQPQSLGFAAGFAASFLAESIGILERLDTHEIECMATGLAAVRESGGRLFILGVGGSAGHAGHAVNDFRKICGFEAYAPTDNVSELTARVNDEGWDTCFAGWLEGSRIQAPRRSAGVLGGRRQPGKERLGQHRQGAGNRRRRRARTSSASSGRDGGFTRQAAEACVVIPTASPERITPHTEGLCAVVWHLLVSHPSCSAQRTKWESVR